MDIRSLKPPFGVKLDSLQQVPYTALRLQTPRRFTTPGTSRVSTNELEYPNQSVLPRPSPVREASGSHRGKRLHMRMELTPPGMSPEQNQPAGIISALHGIWQATRYDFPRARPFPREPIDRACVAGFRMAGKVQSWH